MNDEQLRLWNRLMEIFEELAQLKFEKGTIEHSGLITDLSLEELELAETEEIIDLVHYRITKILKMRDERNA